MASEIKSLNELKQEAIDSFVKLNDCEPTVLCCAPGRVNLIGGHVDYSEGFVLPMALPLVTVCAGGHLHLDDNQQPYCVIHTTSDLHDVKQSGTQELKLPVKASYFNAGTDETPREKNWSDYVAATILSFQQPVKPFYLCISSSVPLGGGLSSSAAIEVAVYTFLEVLCGLEPLKTPAKALACQKAEHLVGIPCGIMDQMVSVMAKPNKLLLLDCKSLEISHVPLQDPKVGVLITNSNVKHDLGNSEYPVRRRDCEIAASILGVKSLRDVSMTTLINSRDKLSPIVYKRAFHVVSEIQRVCEAVDALRWDDHQKLGRLITESHVSLRDNYDVSCKELDQLVEIVNRIEGVYGSRLVGGGFGGCTVTWLELDKTDQVKEAIKMEYEGNASFFVCQPSGGATVL